MSSEAITRNDLANILNEIMPFDYIRDVTSQFTVGSGETPANFKAWKMGDMVFLSYQGASKTHSANALILTASSDVRYGGEMLFPFTKNASTYGTMRQNADGTIEVNQISSTTNTGRIYFNTFWLIGGGA